MTPPDERARKAEPSRDWPEDASHENGNYNCLCLICRNTFVGHKRRAMCRLCSEKERRARSAFIAHLGAHDEADAIALWQQLSNEARAPWRRVAEIIPLNHMAAPAPAAGMREQEAVSIILNHWMERASHAEAILAEIREIAADITDHLARSDGQYRSALFSILSKAKKAFDDRQAAQHQATEKAELTEDPRIGLYPCCGYPENGEHAMRCSSRLTRSPS